MISYHNRCPRRAYDGMLWDSRNRRWVDLSETSTGETTMEKTVPQMTAEYNEHAVRLGLKTVKKFKDRATATRRLDEIITRPAQGTNLPAEKPRTEGTVMTEKDREETVKAFGFRSGSTREKLLLIFLEDFESQVPKSKIKGLDVAGIEWMIGNKKLKFTVKTAVAAAGDGKKKEKTYGLYRVHAKRD